MIEKETKSIYNIAMHEMISFKNEMGGNVEVTRVPGGWVYSFDYPAIRQSPIVFVPFIDETIKTKKTK